jgi:excisionase family DNA binding protein
MKTNQAKKLSHLAVREFEEAAIKQRADRVGKQIGEAVSSYLTEIMIFIVATRLQEVSPVSQVATLKPRAILLKPLATFSRPQQAASQEPDGILKASDVSQILRISKGKAYRMMQQGEIPSIQFGRTKRVKRQDLEEFIRTHMK